MANSELKIITGKIRFFYRIKWAIDDKIRHFKYKYMYPTERFIKGFKNFWTFRKEIHDWHASDYEYTMRLFFKSLEELEKGIKSDSNHVGSKDRAKEINKCRKALQRLVSDNYIRSEWNKLPKFKFKRITVNGLQYHKMITPKSRQDKTRLLYQKEKVLKNEDWKTFLHNFKQFQRWWY